MLSVDGGLVVYEDDPDGVVSLGNRPGRFTLAEKG